MTTSEATEREPKELMSMGVLKVKDPYPAAVLSDWNRRLDPIFDQRGDHLPRAYVDCAELDGLGILSEALTPEIRALIRALLPDGLIYHCLASEIPTGQRDPHVSADRPGGWHQDFDALGSLDPTSLTISALWCISAMFPRRCTAPSRP